VTCSKCGGSLEFDLLSGWTQQGKREVIEGLIFEENRYLRTQAESLLTVTYGPCPKGNHSVRLSEIGYIDYRLLYVRDPPYLAERFSELVYNVREVHLFGPRMPPSRRCRLEGWVCSHPTKHDLVVIADKIEPEEQEFERFEPTESDRESWRKYFAGRELGELADQIAPSIVGEARRKAKEAALLMLHSPAQIPDVGQGPSPAP